MLPQLDGSSNASTYESTSDEKRLGCSGSLENYAEIEDDTARKHETHTTAEEICNRSRSQSTKKGSQAEDRDNQGLVSRFNGWLSVRVSVTATEFADPVWPVSNLCVSNCVS